MNKRYMDFVPKANKPKVSAPKTSASASKVSVSKSGVNALEQAREAKAVKLTKAKPSQVRTEVRKSVPEKTELEAKRETTPVAAKKADEKMKLPSRAFINTEKVEKRPLSRNVYKPKQIIAPKEEPKGTVTIIEKPEKDSRMGLVVTIIITIILGAAAGTVAFLLLPK